MKNSPLLLLLGIFLAFCSPALRAEIYGSGVFILNDGDVYSTDGDYIGSSSLSGGSTRFNNYGSTSSVGSGGIPVVGSWDIYIPVLNPPGPRTITVSAINGTVSKTPDQSIYEYGVDVTLAASPLPGYRLKEWTRNGVPLGSSSLTLSVRAMENSHFVANFELITRIAVLDGSALVWPQQQTGTSLSHPLLLRNTGNSPLHVTQIVCPVGFSGNWNGEIAPGAEQSIPISFSPTSRGIYSGSLTIESDATAGTTTLAVSAGAENAYEVTGSSTFPGSSAEHFRPFSSTAKMHLVENLTSASVGYLLISSYPDVTTPYETRQYWEGSVVHFQAAPVDGYTFINWTENGRVISTSAEFDLPIFAAHNVQAHYEIPTRLVRVESFSTFGARRVGSTSRRFIRITNTGNSPVFLTGLKFAPRLGDRRSPFSGTWSGWIQPGQVQRVAITFKPTRSKTYRAVVSVEGIALGNGINAAFLDGRGL